MAEDLRAEFRRTATKGQGSLTVLPAISEELLENGNTVKFLQWFCSNFYETNAITADELMKYQKIKSSGMVAQGDQLKEHIERVECFSCVAVDDLSAEQLRQEISDLQQDIVQAKEHLDTLVQIKTELDHHHTDLLDKKDSSQTAGNYYQQLQQRKLYACKESNTKLNESLEELKHSVEDTMKFYSESDGEVCCYGSSKSEEQSSFLSSYSLGSYHSIEEKYTQTLVAYTRKQFFQGIANLGRLAYDEDGEGDDRSFKIEGELREMQRLQALYPLSEVKMLNTVAKEQQLLAAMTCAEKQVMLLSQPHYAITDDEENLMAQISKLQEKLAAATEEIVKAGHYKLPDLVHKLADLMSISVLNADCDLKLARQDYFTSKQDKVIYCLSDQLSHHKLLLMMYEVELRRHHELQILCKAAQSQLNIWKEEHDNKVKLLQEISQVLPAQPYQTINPTDDALYGVYKLLEDCGKAKATQVPLFSELLSSSKQLVYHVNNLENACQVLQIRKLQHTTELHGVILRYEDLLRKCNVVIYPSHSGALNKEAVDTLHQLTAAINKLEGELKQIMQEFNLKKRMLATNPLLQKERELFTFFFTDPVKLQQVFSELVTTVDSHALLQSKAIM